MTKTFIFDFDGTLADTLDLLIEAYNRMAATWKGQLITPEEKEMLRMESPHVLLKRYHIPILKLPRLVLKLRAALHSKIDQIRIPKERVEMLKKLKTKGETIGMLTSNSRENVDAILERHGLSDTFEFILTGKQLFGKDRALKKILKTRNLTGKDVFYIGDEVRDIEAAKRAGIVSVAVTWGFNHREALEKAKPDHLIESPKNLCAL